MNIGIGSDHRGVAIKTRIARLLESMGHTVEDCGAYSSDSCDYPDIAHAVAGLVSNGNAERGILVCGSGIGMSIAANKTTAVRAALCHDPHAAEMSRRHNDANVLCLSADHLETLSDDAFNALIETWMTTEFEGGRHQRRVDKITTGVKSACHE
ncbi:MAG: ribose 5-phosphate isomerase B [Pirellulaceae bacterium]|nr:ribose 5-phosphate isomerase B [Pirellulaceae bacterium]